MYRVRFHLGAGPHFEHWQVKNESGVVYYDPGYCSLLLYDCKLRNQKKTAQKIFSGADKTVCAWVECSHYVAYNYVFNPGPIPVIYNPHKNPFWVIDGENADGKFLHLMTSSGRRLYTR